MCFIGTIIPIIIGICQHINIGMTTLSFKFKEPFFSFLENVTKI